MDRVRAHEKKEKGVLSIIDGMIFGVIILIVTLFIFQAFGGALTEEKDLRGAEFRKEAVQDIQKTALVSMIDKTGFVNESGYRNVSVEYENITEESAVKEYLYLDHKAEMNEELSYNLSRMENDIEEVYRVCAREVSNFHFAVGSSYGEGKLFVSDLSDRDTIKDLPSDRGAATSTVMIAQQQVDITLYIWR